MKIIILWILCRISPQVELSPPPILMSSVPHFRQFKQISSTDYYFLVIPIEL